MKKNILVLIFIFYFFTTLILIYKMMFILFFSKMKLFHHLKLSIILDLRTLLLYYWKKLEYNKTKKYYIFRYLNF